MHHELPRAITFDLAIGFSSSTPFLETKIRAISRGFKIKPIQGSLKVVALEGPPPRKACRGYKRPQAPFRPKKRCLPRFCSLPEHLLHIFSLIQTRKTHKNTSKPLDSSLHQKHKVLFLYPISFYLVLHFGIWGLGVWI